MNYIIDLDGTICTETDFRNRSKSKLIKGARATINELYKKKNNITIYTARSWNELKKTEKWLKKNKIKYHQLILGKPIGDIWIDDRAIKFTNWKTVLKKIKHKNKN